MFTGQSDLGMTQLTYVYIKLTAEAKYTTSVITHK